MRSISNKQIDGDVSVGRNVAVGGKVTVQGSSRFKGGLKVDGWLDAKNIKGANKGIFTSVAKLQEAYPMPHDGWWAIVGVTLPGPIYVGDGGEWAATGETGGNPTLDSEQYNETVNELRGDITLIQQDITDIETKDKEQDTLAFGFKNAISALTASAHTHANKGFLDTLTGETLKLDLPSGTVTIGGQSWKPVNSVNLDIGYFDFMPGLNSVIYPNDVMGQYTLKNGYVIPTTAQAAQWHSHENKTVLDALTQSVITDSHSHGNKTVLDALTQSVITDSHSHGNKTVLDGIGADSVMGIADLIDGAIDVKSLGGGVWHGVYDIGIETSYKRGNVLVKSVWGEYTTGGQRNGSGYFYAGFGTVGSDGKIYAGTKWDAIFNGVSWNDTLARMTDMEAGLLNAAMYQDMGGNNGLIADAVKSNVVMFSDERIVSNDTIMARNAYIYNDNGGGFDEALNFKYPDRVEVSPLVAKYEFGDIQNLKTLFAHRDAGRYGNCTELTTGTLAICISGLLDRGITTLELTMYSDFFNNQGKLLINLSSYNGEVKFHKAYAYGDFNVKIRIAKRKLTTGGYENYLLLGNPTYRWGYVSLFIDRVLCYNSYRLIFDELDNPDDPNIVSMLTDEDEFESISQEYSIDVAGDPKSLSELQYVNSKPISQYENANDIEISEYATGTTDSPYPIALGDNIRSIRFPEKEAFVYWKISSLPAPVEGTQKTIMLYGKLRLPDATTTTFVSGSKTYTVTNRVRRMTAMTSPSGSSGITCNATYQEEPGAYGRILNTNIYTWMLVIEFRNGAYTLTYAPII